MHQGGVSDFSAQEAFVMLGELYASRRRDGDRIEMLMEEMQDYNRVISEKEQQIEQQQLEIVSLQEQLDKTNKKLDRQRGRK